MSNLSEKMEEGNKMEYISTLSLSLSVDRAIFEPWTAALCIISVSKAYEYTQSSSHTSSHINAGVNSALIRRHVRCDVLTSSKDMHSSREIKCTASLVTMISYVVSNSVFLSNT